STIRKMMIGKSIGFLAFSAERNRRILLSWGTRRSVRDEKFKAGAPPERCAATTNFCRGVVSPGQTGSDAHRLCALPAAATDPCAEKQLGSTEQRSILSG